MKEDTFLLQPGTYIFCIYQIAVVSKGKGSFYVIQHQRLGILDDGGSCGGVPYMTDAKISVKRSEGIFLKYFTDQSHSLVRKDIAFGT